MKIAYVYDTIYPYSFGGVERRIWELSIRLFKKGHEVHVFGPKFWEGADVIQREGVLLHGVCKPPKARFGDGRRTIMWPLYFSARLFPVLIKDKFDVIDCQNFPYFTCFPVKLIAALKKSTLVITWHEVWGNYWYEYLGKVGILGKMVEILTASLVCKLVAVSGLTKNNLAKIRAKKHINVIHNGIDLEQIQNYTPSDSKSDIIFIGRLIKEKNVDFLVKTVLAIKDRSSEIRCLIIGEGPERKHIEELIIELKLETNIILLSKPKDNYNAFSYMKSSKVLVIPSVREGFGIVAIEANACGIPVVTILHPRSAVSELIVEGENGFISELSEKDFGGKILKALSVSEGLREKCIKHVENYNWNIITAEIEKVYETK